MTIRIGKLRFFDDPIEMTRLTGGDYDDSGRWVEGSASIINIVGNLQPFIDSGKETFVAPDGLIAEDAKTLFTQDEVRTVDQYGLTEADRFFLSPTQEYVAFQLYHYTHKQMKLHHRQVLLLRRKE